MDSEELLEQAELVESIAMSHAHPYQDVEEWNEWREIHAFAMNVIEHIKEDELYGDKRI